MNNHPIDTRRIENAHVAFWLLKDFSWCTSTRWLGLTMIVPTMLLALRLTCVTRASREDFVHNAATCFWIGANIVWMVGEFFFDDGTRQYARILFWIGLLILGVYYASVGVKRMTT